MTLYLLALTKLRQLTLVASLLIALVILLGYNTYPALLPMAAESALWKINSLAIFFVMVIRPLSDLIPKQKWLRQLVICRKEFGILSATIVLSFGLAKYISWGGVEFFQVYFSQTYWPFPEAKFWGRVGELVAIPLLLTSNNWSIRKLGASWKRIQKLSYLYFFSGSYFVWATFGAVEELWFMAIVITLTLASWGKKRWKRLIK